MTLLTEQEILALRTSNGLKCFGRVAPIHNILTEAQHAKTKQEILDKREALAKYIACLRGLISWESLPDK